MPPSHAGWSVARFPNNNRAREKPLLIPISKSSPLDGKLAATISLSCIENWSPVATLTRIIQCMSTLFACFQKDGRIPRLLIRFHALLCLHDKQFSLFFVDLKN